MLVCALFLVAIPGRSEQKPADGGIGLAVPRTPCYHAPWNRPMIQSFRDAGTEDVFNGRHTKAARRACPESLWPVAARKLEQVDSAASLGDLRVPPGNRLEALSGDRRGQHSVRVNDRYRVCFVWTVDGPIDVEIVNYH